MIASVHWEDGQVLILDQTRLPQEEAWLRLSRWEEVAEAIRTMRVRGAPAIGIAAAYALALAVWTLPPGADPEAEFKKATKALALTRPTAVNLSWAIGRMERALRENRNNPELREALLAEAKKIHEEDVAANRRIGELGASLLPEGSSVLTLCNTGALATGGHGTALGVIRTAWSQGKLALVYVSETRPLLQGARLTAWELLREEIPFRIIVDGAAGWLLSQGKVDAVLVGADRIARNGDVANKIGTYPLAVLAQRHRVPFYCVAPCSSVDPSLGTGKKIPIEERAEEEVLGPAAPAGARAWNPAFDVTPGELITAIVTERGVLRPPYDQSLPQVLA